MKTKLELFLEKEGLTERFKKNLDFSWGYYNSIYGDDKMAIIVAFFWENSGEGVEFWNIVDKNWLRFLSETNEPNEQVNSPKHYNRYAKETIDMMVDIFGVDKVIAFCEVNALKYRMRAGLKGDANVDLQKEQWYLDKAEELKNK